MKKLILITSLFFISFVSAGIHTLEIVAIEENPCLGGADINHDSKVDGTDLSFLSGKFGMVSCSPINSYCDCADINHDSKVDGTDLSILGRDFGQVSEVSSPKTPASSGSSSPEIIISSEVNFAKALEFELEKNPRLSGVENKTILHFESKNPKIQKSPVRGFVGFGNLLDKDKKSSFFSKLLLKNNNYVKFINSFYHIST
jgi:hypothetical protein